MPDTNSQTIFGFPSSFQLLTAGLFGAGVVLLINNFKKKRNPFRNKIIDIINNIEECSNAVNNIKRKTLKYKVIGFDCEWVTKNGQRHPIALLQISSYDGYCALFRLNKIHHIPHDLKSILEDVSIIKVGVAAVNDAKYLYNDYAVSMRGIVDLRHLSVELSEKPDGLSNLSEKYLKFKMDKSWTIRCSNWENATLTDSQVNYAATDVLVAMEVFKIIINKIISKKYEYFWNWNYFQYYFEDVEKSCQKYIDVNFKNKAKKANIDASNTLLSDYQKRHYHTYNNKITNRNTSPLIKKKVLYQNCIMETAEGEILCTCDRKKADWYVSKELAEVFCDDPFTIRLRFEPAGKSVGSVGQFYQIPRENRCVVCGASDSYIRKNVVPKEYRKLFPNVMKDHSCHDVLLLCQYCHQLSNIKDQIMRIELAEMCNAPICNKDTMKLVDNIDLKKVTSASRALLKQSNIPNERKLELESIIREYCPTEKFITEEMLKELSGLNYRVENSLYEPHGKIVVEYFKNNAGGLLKLEHMWRNHFIKMMNPKFMPKLWSTTHNELRLEIRAKEGRINKEDLEIAGLSIEIENCKNL